MNLSSPILLVIATLSLSSFSQSLKISCGYGDNLGTQVEVLATKPFKNQFGGVSYSSTESLIKILDSFTQVNSKVFTKKFNEGVETQEVLNLLEKSDRLFVESNRSEIKFFGIVELNESREFLLFVLDKNHLVFPNLYVVDSSYENLSTVKPNAFKCTRN